MKRILFIIIALFIINIVSFSQKPAWIANPFEHFVFIENKGQFDQQNSDKNNRVYYNANSKGVEIYFHSNGLTYAYDEVVSSLTEEEKERMERSGKEEIEKSTKRNTKYLHVEWVGANPFAVIEGNDVQSFYYTYPCVANNGSTTFKAACFKKITYKNLYPNIDVEYILPEKGGVKYSLILHPGADPLVVRMKYINAKEITTDKQGNIIIKSEFGDFVDHAPVSFYAPEGTSETGLKIESAFELKETTVSFSVSESAIHNLQSINQTIIIDPWTSNPGFPVNRAYDVNYDLAGNVYTCGSGSLTQAYKLAKYNSGGTLQWVFTTNIALGAVFYGDFAVDEVSGTSYFMQTMGTGPTSVIKINTIGVQTGGFAPGVFPGGFELWRCEYNRCLNKIVVGCGGTNTTFQSGMLDTSLTSFTPVNSYSASKAFYDIALLAIDPNSSFCYMATATHSGSVANDMIKVPVPNLLPRAWGPVWNGHTFIEIASVAYTPAIQGGGTLYSNGFNGMACGPRFLYTYDGSVLKKWNKNTGVLIAQINTGGTMFTSGGLSVDKCDNVYAGVGNVIKQYNSSLVQIATYPVANTCYDVKLGPNNKLYASGAAFVAQIDVPPLAPPTATSTPASTCNACNGTATALPCGDPSGYNYLWSAGGQVTQTATGLCPGTYTVSITYACSDVDVITVSVTGGAGGISLTSTQTNACSNAGTVALTASGGTNPYTYLWSSGQTSSGLTGLSPGNYTITATDANGCSTFKIIKIVNTININYTSKYAGCSGGNTGSITLIVSGGSPIYSYVWSNGQTDATATNLFTGTYTVTVTDANSCIQTKTITLAPFVPIQIQTGQTTACTGNAEANVISVTGGTPSYNYNWSNSQVGPKAANLSAGTYTVTVSDANGCTTTRSVTITNGPNPANAAFTQSPTGTICAGATVNFTNTGTTDFLAGHKWSIPGQGPVVTGVATDFTSYFLNFSYTFTTAGTYTVNHTVSYPSGGCTSTQSTTIAVINCTGPIITATGSSTCNGICASVTSIGTGGTSPYTYSWSTGATTQNISPCPSSTTTYTVTIRDNGGNTSTSTAVVTINPSVTLSTSTTNVSCYGGTDGSIIANPLTGTPNYTYNWSGGVPGSGFQVSGLSAGNYTVTVTDNKGCTGTSTVTIAAPPILSGQFTKGTANCAGCGCQEWLMITASGGTSPYSYSWSATGGIVNRYRNQLCPGTYNVNIKDKNGCSINVNLTAP